MTVTPRTFRIIATNPILQFAVVTSAILVSVSVLAWATYAFGWAVPIHSFQKPPSLLKIGTITGPAILVVGLPAAWWVVVTKRTFRNGESRFGTITRIMPSEGGTAVEYRFSWNGIERTSRAFSSVNARLRALAVGDRISVVVDPASPKHTFIRELYIENSEALSG